MSDRKLLLERLERLAIVLDELMPQCAELVRDDIAMLKEQQQRIWEFQDQVEYLTGKQKERKFLVDSDGKITPLPVVVRCKDCANGEVCTQSWDGVQYVECHAHEEEGYDHEDGHPLGWFCADGKRRTD